MFSFQEMFFIVSPMKTSSSDKKYPAIIKKNKCEVKIADERENNLMQGSFV